MSEAMQAIGANHCSQPTADVIGITIGGSDHMDVIQTNSHIAIVCGLSGAKERIIDRHDWGLGNNEINVKSLDSNTIVNGILDMNI